MNVSLQVSDPWSAHVLEQRGKSRLIRSESDHIGHELSRPASCDSR